MSEWVPGGEFEQRVLHIARALWPGAKIAGPVIVDGRERDGIFLTEEAVHAVEATALRTLEKARQDCAKLESLGKKLRVQFPEHAVKLWFVTKDAPTAEQRTEAVSRGVSPVSISEFQGRLIDVRTLLDCRKHYPFGSNDEVGPNGRGEKYFVDYGICDSSTGQALRAQDFANGIASGRRFMLLGDFGAGKSTNLIQAYRRLETLFLKGESHQFPLFINLRDHHGQEEADEILTRHAKRIGFPVAAHLVRAWRAGYCHLLIDGFDEIAPSGATAKKSLLKTYRRQALIGVKELISQQPSGCGVVLSGRPNYFDSREERVSSLGASGFADLTLSDFTDEQVQTYFKQVGLSGGVPSWFPKRPYLVATLARREVGIPEGAAEGPGAGWDMLLSQIFDREAAIAPMVEGRAVREIAERLATKARTSFSGLGPLSGSDFQSAFKDVCGFEPDEKGQQLLARLSGLAGVRAGEDSRSFVDEDFADACRAGDVGRFVVAPWGGERDRLEDAIRALGPTGVAVLDHVLSEDLTESLLQSSLEQATGAVKLDVWQLLSKRGISPLSVGIARDVVVSEVELLDAPPGASKLSIVDGFVDKLIFNGKNYGSCGLEFQSTWIREIVGPSGPSDVPRDFLDDGCSVDTWASEATRNAAVLASVTNVALAVMLTILRKTFIQTGNGRREDALYRGLGVDEQRYVEPVLAQLSRHQLLQSWKKRGRLLWIPNRGFQDRVNRILKSPNTSSDEVVVAVKLL